MTHKITAKTAKGAASQVARALRREIQRVYGVSQEEAERSVIIRESWYGRGIVVSWEDYSPYEWAIIASGGGDIWAEEMGRPLHSGEPTLRGTASNLSGAHWMSEPETGIALGFYPQ